MTNSISARNLARFLLAITLTASANAFSAGTVSFVTGQVSLTSGKGEARQVVAGLQIEARDTITTGQGGEVHIVTDDKGLIAMRQNSRLRIDEYVADGDSKDRAEMTLLRGFLRSITGWISKTAPSNYRIHAASATVGIRGTDHELGIDEDGAESGVYSKVNEGETFLRNPAGEVQVFAGRMAFVDISRPAAPRLVDGKASVFKPSANEKVINDLKGRLSQLVERELVRRQTGVLHEGGKNAGGNVRLGDGCAGGMAEQELADLARTYEAGNLPALMAKLDPAMLGYQRFIDGVTRDFNRQKQTRMTFKDISVQCGPDLATLQFTWEKRYLDAVSFAPALATGRSTLLMHQSAGKWQTAGIAGDNPFSSLAGALAQLTFGPTFSLAGVSTVPTNVPVTIQVVDSDLAGLGALNVQVISTQGDAEVLSLTEISPGRFSRTGLMVAAGAAVPGNGIVELATGGTLTLRYVDQNPGNNLPPTMLTQSLKPTGSILFMPDTTPDAFSFPPVSNAQPGTQVISASATISGINAATPVTIVGGDYSIGGSAFTVAPGTIANNQSIRVRVTASSSSGGVATAVINVGGVTQAFSATTAVFTTNVVPDPFQFTSINNAPTNQTFTSNVVTVTGLTSASPISIVGGAYSINGGPFTALPGQVSNNQTIAVRLISAGTALTTISATLSVGGYAATYSVTTAPVTGISTPNPFSFLPQTNVAVATLVTSQTVTISGINVVTPVTVVGGQYSINGGPFTAAPGSITNNQTLTLRVLSSSSLGSTTSATVNVGGVSATFLVTTTAPITTPNPFTFTPQLNVPPSTVVNSNTVSVVGINTSAPVSIIGGSYAIGTGPFVATAGVITNNQTVTVRVTSSPITDGTGSVTATLIIGGFSAPFTVTTWDTVPNAFAFANLVTTQVGVPPCFTVTGLSTAQYTTSAVTISGLTSAAPVTLTAVGANPGATMSINGGAFTPGPATISNGQLITVRVKTVGALTGPLPASRAVVNIGGVSSAVTQTCQ